MLILLKLFWFKTDFEQDWFEKWQSHECSNASLCLVLQTLHLKMNPSVTTQYALPCELWDHIPGFLHSDYTSLRSCALVSLGWLTSARLHLDYPLTLHIKNVDPILELFLAQNFTLKPSIRRVVVLGTHEYIRRDTKRVLKALSKLSHQLSPTSLEFKGLNWPHLESILKDDWDDFPQPKELVITGGNFDDIHHLDNLLSRFSGVQALILDDMELYHEVPGRDVPRFSLRLTSLSLTSWYSSMSLFLKYFLQGKIAATHSLCVAGLDFRVRLLF